MFTCVRYRVANGRCVLHPAALALGLVMLVCATMPDCAVAESRLPDFRVLERDAFAGRTPAGDQRAATVSVQPVSVAPVSVEPVSVEPVSEPTVIKPAVTAPAVVAPSVAAHPESPPQASATPPEPVSPAVPTTEKVLGSIAIGGEIQQVRSARTWTLRLEDERVDLALLRWSREAGFGYRWDAERFFPVVAATAFEGSFEDAIQQLLGSPGILNSAYPLEACIYANRPPLLRVTRMGDQSQECR